MKRKPSARWRNTPNLRGLASVGQSPRGYELRLGGETILKVAAIGGGPRYNGPLLGWYWYGMGENTSGKPLYNTKEQARVAAYEFYLSARKLFSGEP